MYIIIKHYVNTVKSEEFRIPTKDELKDFLFSYFAEKDSFNGYYITILKEE